MGKALGGGSGWVLLTFLPRDGTPGEPMGRRPHACRWPAAFRSWRSTCTSTRTTWTSAQRPAPMSTRSWPTSTGRRSTSATRRPCTARASRSAASQDDLAAAAGARRAARRHVRKGRDRSSPARSWRDPAAVADWARDVPRDKEIVVYCVYGHEVGRATALRLRAQGVKARFLRGGIDALASGRAAGRSQGSRVVKPGRR